MAMRSYDYHRQARIDKAIDKTGGVYPGGNGDEYLHSGLPGVGYVATRWARAVMTEFVCTRAEFEARKAERQGKPDWKDAPEWAQWLAQGSCGQWLFSQGKIGCDFINWLGQGRCFATENTGEVIGNWRDTLEQRPERKRIHPFGDMGVMPKLEGVGTSAYQSSTQKPEPDGAENPSLTRTDFIASRSVPVDVKIDNYICNEPRVVVKPDGAAWWDGEHDVPFDLPPIGTECFVLVPEAERSPYRKEFKKGELVRAKVIAHFKSANGVDVAAFTFESDEGLVYVEHCTKHGFLPLDIDGSSSSPELSSHLANASNELQASAKLLPAESKLLKSITGIIGAIQAIREAV
jgi:hypothetical protein